MMTTTLMMAAGRPKIKRSMLLTATSQHSPTKPISAAALSTTYFQIATTTMTMPMPMPTAMALPKSHVEVTKTRGLQAPAWQRGCKWKVVAVYTVPKGQK
jgi:hypothetical protein